MYFKTLLCFILTTLVLSLPLKQINFTELETHTEPKLVLFGDSVEDDTKSAITVVESLSDELNETVTLDYIFVDKQNADNSNIYGQGGFETLPLVFIQMPNTTHPSHYAGDVSVASIKDYIEERLKPVDYSHVVPFTNTADFYKLYNDNRKPIFVKHFEQWCGHCKELKPEFARAAAKVPDAIFVEVECSLNDENKAFCAKNKVSSFPTLKIFNGNWVNYDGPRSIDSFASFISQNMETTEFDFEAELKREEEEKSFVDPVECEFIKMNMMELQADQSPKVVVFGDIRVEQSQKDYEVIAAAVKESKWEHKIVRIEAYMSANDEIFENDFFKNKTRVFVVAPDAQAPTLFNEELTFSGLRDFIIDIQTPVDYSHVMTFTSEREMIEVSNVQKKPVFLKHYEEWCGHCKALKPHFARAAAKVDSVIFMEVECSKDDITKEFCAKQEIKGYPTLKVFNGKEWIDYEGGRTVGEMETFIKNVEFVESDSAPIMQKVQTVMSKIIDGANEASGHVQKISEEVKSKVNEIVDKVKNLAGKTDL